MKVLITGAHGQVGRALVNSAPSTVHVLSRSRAELNITDRDVVRTCVAESRPDVIVNTAAYTAVDKAESEPKLAEQVNATGARFLAEAASAAKARLIHISTDFVFDGTSSTPYPVDAFANPLNVYGLTKRAGEEAVLAVHPEQSVILRTAWVYAAQGRNFLSTILGRLRAGASLRVVDDQIGTPTAARSVAQAIWKLIEAPAITGIHHWTDAGVASWYDFAVAIAEEAAALGLAPREAQITPIATRDYPTAARRPAFSVLDKSALAGLGITPVHWRQALRAVLQEMRNA